MTVAQRKVQERLRAELEEVNRAVVELKKSVRPQELEGLGDNTPLSEEIDAIQSTESREDDARRLERLLDRAAALDEALRRAEKGLYGNCVDCGREIAPKRLESVPEAARCVGCQEEHERESEGSERVARWSEATELYEKQETYDTEGFARRPESVNESEGLSVQESPEEQQE